MDTAVSLATVRLLYRHDDPGADGSGASLRDRALRSYRRYASIPLRSLTPPHAARAARCRLPGGSLRSPAARSSRRQYAPRGGFASDDRSRRSCRMRDPDDARRARCRCRLRYAPVHALAGIIVTTPVTCPAREPGALAPPSRRRRPGPAARSGGRGSPQARPDGRQDDWSTGARQSRAGDGGTGKADPGRVGGRADAGGDRPGVPPVARPGRGRSGRRPAGSAVRFSAALAEVVDAGGMQAYMKERRCREAARRRARRECPL